MFESVDTQTVGRTPARLVYYKLTSEPSAQVSLNKKLAASKAYSIPPQCADQNPVNLSKIIFSALNFFKHIFNMSVTYLPCLKRIH